MDPLSAGRRIARLIGAADNAPGVIRAYHGSPYSFSRFDASKIGAGEGAQAFGHGLYFAGNDSVADQYRRKLRWLGIDADSPDGRASLFAHRVGDGSAESAIRAMEDRVRIAESEGDSLNAGLYREAVNYLRSGGAVPPAPRGHMYEVEIGYPEQALLDWDRPIGEAMAARMPSEVRRNVELELGGRRAPQFPDGDPVPLATGEVLYRAAGKLGGVESKPGWGSVLNTINDSVTDQARASERLLDAGIPGIRYLDQGSRSAGEGTRNYVMFPGTEDRIRILRQYGLLPPLVAAGINSQEEP